MSAPRHPIVIIPSRLAATRLPNKPLAAIHGEPMIVHVWRRAVEADIGAVLVACGDAAIVEAIETVGGRALLTRSDHPTGSDRIFEAVERIDPDRRHDAIINIQGDLPTIAPAPIRAAWAALGGAGVDIATLATEIKNETERHDPNVVKAVIALKPGAMVGRALYFTRLTAPGGAGLHYHHIGLYAYRRAALARFVGLPQSPLEQRERLEQLRALEDGMRIDVALVDTVPLGVDTPADLERARALLAPQPTR
ncbi:MAG: 3-deoxy-manno-octulosonate cytidylyltransferase [Alphaproteobacteria bacterium]|nr:3-deoxy-manno-octulosonate cytidylyltransferase [Alphaproteobacteria bacterium]